MNRTVKITACVFIIAIAAVLLSYKFNLLDRNVYDTLLLWINFLILALVIIKFGKNPLVNFLHAKKDELAEEIKQVETEKENAEAGTREILKKIEDGEAHFSRIKEKIIAHGKKQKEKIIEEARQQSRYMLSDAKKRVDSYFIQARRNFRAELVDMAVAIATEKVQNEITEKDDHLLLDNYLSAIK